MQHALGPDGNLPGISRLNYTNFTTAFKDNGIVPIELAPTILSRCLSDVARRNQAAAHLRDICDASTYQQSLSPIYVGI